jgi:hypothetical protein
MVVEGVEDGILVGDLDGRHVGDNDGVIDGLYVDGLEEGIKVG